MPLLALLYTFDDFCSESYVSVGASDFVFFTLFFFLSFVVFDVVDWEVVVLIIYDFI